MKPAKSITIYGKVQNVGFRYYTLKTAVQFHIKGWVRNRADGSVYIEAEGDSIDLETFADWCRRGPQWARVDRIEIQDIPYTGFVDFKVR